METVLVYMKILTLVPCPQCSRYLKVQDLFKELLLNEQEFQASS